MTLYKNLVNIYFLSLVKLLISFIFYQNYDSEALYASPTERAPPIWEKPPEAFASESKLQVITRAHHNTKTQPHKTQKRIQGRKENKNSNRRKVSTRNNCFGWKPSIKCLFTQ